MKTDSALGLIFALGISLQGWSAAHAQTATTAPVVVSGKGTTLDITPSGTPVINIAVPNYSGTSYNVFSRLDVGREGTIFNNSNVNTQSVIAGQVIANPNLRGSYVKGFGGVRYVGPPPANLIVAEVRSGSRSNLLGSIEIVGARAGLVIANPAGITCDGCGFINATRATLTTGVPTFAPGSNVPGFQVNGGTVEITGSGLSAATTDYFDIVTSSTQINAAIYARDLSIVGGTGSFDPSIGTFTVVGANNSSFAIDSSVLGGMYANRIRLIGTGAGVGINLRGVVSALDGQLAIAADGNVNLRRVDAGSDATIVSRGGSVRVEEYVASGGATIINAATDITIANNQNAVDEATETTYVFRPYDRTLITELTVAGDNYCDGPIPIGPGTCELTTYSPVALTGASIDALGSVILSSGRDILHINRGSISGDSVSLIANQDIQIGGGGAIFANNLALNAVRDVNLKASTAVRSSRQYTDLGRGLYRNTFLTRTEVTGAQLDAFGSLFVTAGRDVSLEAASLTADGVIGLTAARDIAIGGIASTGTTTQSWKTSKNTTGNSVETVSNYDGTNIAAGSGLYVNANEELDVTGSALRSEGGIDIRAGLGTAYIAGSDIAATGNVVLTGRDIVVTGSVNSSTFDETVRTVKRGFLSKKTTTSVTSNQIETVFASSISGNRVVLDSVREIGILDSDIAGDQAVDITAGGNITIGSIPTTSDYYSSTKVKKVGFSISSEGLFLGISKTSNIVDTTQVSNIGSLIGAASGAVRISAGAGSGAAGLPGVGDLDIVGSRIAALNAVTLSGDTVDIVNNVNLTTTRTSFSSFSLGYTYSIQSPLLNSATSLVRLGDIATNTSNARIQAVSALAAGLAIKNGYDAASNLVSTIRTGDGSLGVTLTQSLGYTRTTSTSLLAEETIVASQVAGGDVTIFARGGAGRSGISIFGSDIAATRDLSVFSNAGIDLGAAIETDRYSGQTSSTGINLSISTSLGLSRQYGLSFSPPTITLGFNSSSSRYNGVDVTARSAILGAGGTATINTLGRLNIDGSQLSANRVLIDAGALNITSRQNTSNYLSRERSVGLSVSYQLGTGNISAAANFAGGNSFGSFATVADQAGIRAGAGGFDINVAGLTELRGGIIASTAAASINRLTTGTFRASSIVNAERYSVYSYNFGLGFGDIGFNSNSGQATSNGSGTALPGIQTPYGTLSFTLPTFLSASASQSSATNSAIAPGTVLIGSGEAASLAALGALSRDTSGANSALTRQFTEARRAEIAQGFDAARQLTSEVTTFFANRAADQQRAEAAAIAAGVERNPDGTVKRDTNGNLVAQRTYDANGNPIYPAQEFINQATAIRRDYGSGSASRILATALSGAAGSNAAGSLGSFAQAAAVNALQSLAVNKVKSIADSFLDANGNPTVRSEAVRTALQALVGCAGGAATGDCSSGALGAASSVVLNNLINALADPQPRDANGNIIPRSLADQEARSNLIATLTGAIAGAVGGNVGAASTAGLIETQNNGLATTASGNRFAAGGTPGQPTDIVYNADPQFRALIDSLARRDANGNIIESGLSVFNALATCISATSNATTCGVTPAQGAALDQYARSSTIITQQINLRAAGAYNPALDPLSPLYGVYDLRKLPGTDGQFPGGLFAGADGIVYSADARAVGRIVSVTNGQLSGWQRFGYGALGTVQVVLGGLSATGAVATSELCATGVGCIVPGAFSYGAFTAFDEGGTNLRRAYEGNSNFSTLGATAIRLANNALGGTATAEDAQRYYSYSQLAAGGVTLGYGGVQAGRYIASRYVTAQEAALNSRFVVNQATIAALNPANAQLVVSNGLTIEAANLASRFQTLGTTVRVADIPVGQQLVSAIRAGSPRLSENAATLYAENYIRSGIAAPIATNVTAGTVLVKIVPAGTSVTPYSGYFLTVSELNSLRGLSPSALADRLGLPLSSRAASYDVYQITATQNTTVFRSTVAPTIQGTVRQGGGATQIIVPNRSVFTPPVRVNVNLGG